MSQYKLCAVLSLAMAGLTACGGGGTSAQSPGLDINQQIQDAVAAPALDGESIAPDLGGESIVSDLGGESIAPDLDGDSFTPDQLILAGAAEVGCEADADIFRETMLNLVNVSRAEARMCGDEFHAAVGTVTWNSQLAETAEIHVTDMATNDFFSHTGSDGLSVADRATGVGYVWRAVGENIAAGQVDQAEVHQGWLDSPGHCENIMNSLFTEVGAACVIVEGSTFSSYWAVVFGDEQ